MCETRYFAKTYRWVIIELPADKIRLHAVWLRDYGLRNPISLAFLFCLRHSKAAAVSGFFCV